MKGKNVQPTYLGLFQFGCPNRKGMGVRMKSIGLKLWSTMMLLVGIMLVLLWLFQIVFLERFYTSMEVANLTKEGKVVVSEMEKLGEIEALISSTKIMDTINAMLGSTQMTVEVVDKSGSIVYQIASNQNEGNQGMLKEVMTEVISKALLDEQIKKELTHTKSGKKYMVIGIPIHIEEEVAGAMVMKVSLAPVEETASILKKQLVIITLILFLVAIVLSYKLSKKFTKPILEIGEAAERYSLGRFDHRIVSKSEDEIGHLAASMNQMGEELAKNEELRKELIANVSHELRTPLTLIRGYAETLRDVTGEYPDKREKQLGVIIDESVRLSKIVEDILSLSQVQAGAISLEQKEFSFLNMLKDVMQRYEVQDFARHIEVVSDCEKRDLIWGDQDRLAQVLFNLINNAINHTEQEDEIVVRVVDHPGFIRVQVEDTGEGMDEEEEKHVFERYYKGKNVEGKKTDGTGLGLAIVKGILDLHQAKYGVESIALKGTTFWFELNKAKKEQ